MFEVGDKVVCVNDSIQPHMIDEISKDFVTWVTKDKEYTVREVLDNKGIVTGVLLEEITNPSRYFRLVQRIQEPAFGTFRFRKLQPAEIKREVEVNEKILVND